MNNNFEKAFTFVILKEGGYSNHPKDSGGETNYGVIQKTYDDYRIRKKLPKQSVKKITQDEVKNIYKEFWLACGADKLDLLSSIAVFDMAINSGPVTAKNLWLKSKNLTTFLANRKKFYLDIVASKPSQKVFLNGWLNRLESLQELLDNISKEGH